jgi:DNA repair exonuclease SbcCD ATPase subunit
VGKKENNDLYSNGVGKTSIFKAIQYVLFNEAEINLERVILDDAPYCQVVFDFQVGDQEYRLSRKRTKKGSADLTLLRRNANEGEDAKVYHSIKDDTYHPYIDKKYIDPYWKDLSGSRNTDTEKDLYKLIKCTYKSFNSTVHFMFPDVGGLATVSAEKRKGILKDALGLFVYAKLEEIAKKWVSKLSKDIEKEQLAIEAIGDPDKDLITISSTIEETDKQLLEKNTELSALTDKAKEHSEKVSELTQFHTNLENKFAALISSEKSLSSECSRHELSVKEYTTKTSNTIKQSKSIIAEINSLKETQAKLAAIDYSQIDILNEQIIQKRDKATEHNVNVKNATKEYEDLKIPLPSGSVCKACRKPISDSERKDCQEHINNDMASLQNSIRSSKEVISVLNAEIAKHQTELNSLNRSKQELDGINTKIANSKRDFDDKKELHQEYSSNLEKYKTLLQGKSKELEDVRRQISSSSIEEANNIKRQIEDEKKKIAVLNPQITALNKVISNLNSSKAVAQHNFDQRTNDKERKASLKENLAKMQNKYSRYPSVIQGFSSTGIPNLIIQDMLDELQLEANGLLSQLRPDMQLSFLVEKTKGDGEQADTLDIMYSVNGKTRYYEQLSGAMRLSVIFSLKLGLSRLLQHRLGTDIRLLLLDEIDCVLDKASTDALAEIVKFFSTDYTILVITHNDRMQDKFSHHVLVEQDINMVSRAKVVSSY